MQALGILLAIAVVIGLFWIGRELVCWYWKINESLAVMTEVRDLLKRSVNAQERIADSLVAAQIGTNPSQPTDATPGAPSMFLQI